jgi:hypothetical protein
MASARFRHIHGLRKTHSHGIIYVTEVNRRVIAHKFMRANDGSVIFMRSINGQREAGINQKYPCHPRKVSGDRSQL